MAPLACKVDIAEAPLGLEDISVESQFEVFLKMVIPGLRTGCLIRTVTNIRLDKQIFMDTQLIKKAADEGVAMCSVLDWDEAYDQHNAGGQTAPGEGPLPQTDADHMELDL